MKNIFLFSVLLASINCIGQKQKAISAYADFNVSITTYDRTINNNSVGFGGGLQAFVNTKSKFRPNIEVWSAAFGGNKLLKLTPNGDPIWAKETVTSLLAGTSFKLSKNTYLNFTAGPSFLNPGTYFTIKPGMGFYFFKNQRGVFKISFSHIFQRDRISNDGFGFLNFGLGMKLF